MISIMARTRRIGSSFREAGRASGPCIGARGGLGSEERGGGGLFPRLAGTLVLGAPLVGYAWHTLSEALSGRVHPVPIFVSLVFLAAAFALLRRLAAAIVEAGRSGGGGDS